MLLVDDDESEVGERQKQGRARADDRRASPLAVAVQTRSRWRSVKPECHSAGRAPKREAKRSRNWAVSAISGRSTSAWRFCRKASAMASK